MTEFRKERSNSGWIRSLRLSAQMGAEWLSQQQKSENGEFKDCGPELTAYYKAPLMFSTCGRIESGNRCLGFIKRYLNNSGELNSGREKTNFDRLQRNLANYMDAWVAIGAWRLNDYAFSEQITAVLKKHQNVTSGGVATGPKKWAGLLRYDLATAASCGRAFLITGCRREAIAAGNFLVEALNHQEDVTSGLSLCFNERWKILETPSTSERTYYRLDLSKRGEKVWFPAFSCAFLCELFQVTGDIRYLKSAESYFSYITRTIEYSDGLLANGKSGWSAGLLALLTSDEKYLCALRNIAPNVIARQKENGEFGPSPRSLSVQNNLSEKRPEPPMPRRLETTAEFTTWSTEFLRFFSLGFF
jgi:hypothetical protein